jgi:hypothetical protein
MFSRLRKILPEEIFSTSHSADLEKGHAIGFVAGFTIATVLFLWGAWLTH